MHDPLELTRRAEATHFWFRGFRRFVEPVLDEVAGGRRNLRLIDCGCGVGQNLSLLSPYGAAVGFDLALPGAVAARTAGHPITRASLTQIPFPSDVFDVATCFDVLQCIEPDAAAVREMARIIRPGGSLVLTVAALELLRGDHSELWQEVRRYTPHGVRQLVRAAGLEVVDVRFLFAAIFPIMLAARAVQRALRPFRPAPAATDMAVPPPWLNEALTGLLTAEAAASRYVPMPVGSSLLVVARKAAPASSNFEVRTSK